MADDRFDVRTTHVREATPWAEFFRFTELFRTARIAMEPRKLLIAAAGILTMACGWWVISLVFYSCASQPVREKNYLPPSDAEYERKYPNEGEAAKHKAEDEIKLKNEYDQAVDHWLQLHYLAGDGEATAVKSDGSVHKVWGGKLRTLPWYEDRGPNPYLLITGRERPWEQGDFVGWFLSREVPVLIEPLIKFLEPIMYLISPRTDTYTRLYLLVLVFWTLATWALFGGVITRMASVELAGKETAGVKEAFRFVARRYLSYLLAPLVPFAFMAVLVILAIVFGAFHLIPYVGDVLVSGLLWPIPMLIGLGMALLLVGLVGYPMMYPTISVEGSDTLDALSRSYNYVYQAPRNYIWYSVVSICYGAVVVFFVGLVGSLTIYLGQWAMSNTPFIDYAKRSPQFLFIYTPTSFGWRELLLSGSEGEEFVRLQEQEMNLLRLPENKKQGSEYETRLAEVRDKKVAAERRYNEWLSTAWASNKIGAGMVAFWVTLWFLMILGFGYSFFWTTSTMVYLLMRKSVDDTDLDEVYLEDEETEDVYGKPGGSTLPMTSAEPPSGKLEMVDLNVKTDKPAAPETTSTPAVSSEPPPAPPHG
jgi:hypothetical protein